MPSSTPEQALTASPNTAPVAPEFARAAAAGVCWAAIATLSAGLPPSALLPLCLGAVCTQLACLLTLGAFDGATAARARMAACAGLLALSALVIGQVIQNHTHHRPLGAVAWVMLVVALIAPILALVRRVNPGPVVGWSILLVAVAICAVVGRSAIDGTGWIQWVAGLVCLGGALLHRSRWPEAGSALAWPTGGALALGAAWVFWKPAEPMLSERAALVLGWVGLF